MANGGLAPIPTPQFPTHNAPRVWLLTSGDSPIGISVARQVLDHGDYVVSGIIQAEFEHESLRSQEFKDFLAEVVRTNGWKDRLKIVPLDIRYEALPMSLYYRSSQHTVLTEQ
jgi:NAD(P)-dependent dehydrogenase (short-subunit alcohol dehydrogenase family)